MIAKFNRLEDDHEVMVVGRSRHKLAEGGEVHRANSHERGVCEGPVVRSLLPPKEKSARTLMAAVTCLAYGRHANL